MNEDIHKAETQRDGFKTFIALVKLLKTESKDEWISFYPRPKYKGKAL